jgi:hypothetical protein
MLARWKMAATLVAVWVVAATILGACSETLPLVNLPNIGKLPEKVLSKDEQQRTMKEMIDKAQTNQADTIKQIEQAK